MMGISASGDRAALVTAGVQAASVEWRGGTGTFMTWGGTLPSGGIALQMSPDSGTTWIAVRALGAAEACAVTAHGTANFALPRCLIRASAAWTSGNALAVHV